MNDDSKNEKEQSNGSLVGKIPSISLLRRSSTMNIQFGQQNINIQPKSPDKIKQKEVISSPTRKKGHDLTTGIKISTGIQSQSTQDQESSSGTHQNNDQEQHSKHDLQVPLALKRVTNIVKALIIPRRRFGQLGKLSPLKRAATRLGSINAFENSQKANLIDALKNDDKSFQDMALLRKLLRDCGFFAHYAIPMGDDVFDSCLRRLKLITPTPNITYVSRGQAIRQMIIVINGTLIRTRNSLDFTNGNSPSGIFTQGGMSPVTTMNIQDVDKNLNSFQSLVTSQNNFAEERTYIQPLESVLESQFIQRLNSPCYLTPTDDTLLAYISTVDFDDAVAKSRNRELVMSIDSIRECRFFSYWPIVKIKHIVYNSAVVHYKLHQQVYQQGDTSLGQWFIVLEGDFEYTKSTEIQSEQSELEIAMLEQNQNVHMRGANKNSQKGNLIVEEIRVSMLQKGEIFGLEDVLPNQRKRLFSIRCMSSEGVIRCVNDSYLQKITQKAKEELKLLKDLAKQKRQYLDLAFEQKVPLAQQIRFALEKRKKAAKIKEMEAKQVGNDHFQLRKDDYFEGEDTQAKNEMKLQRFREKQTERQLELERIMKDKLKIHSGQEFDINTSILGLKKDGNYEEITMSEKENKFSNSNSPRHDWRIERPLNVLGDGSISSFHNKIKEDDKEEDEEEGQEVNLKEDFQQQDNDNLRIDLEGQQSTIDNNQTPMDLNTLQAPPCFSLKDHQSSPQTLRAANHQAHQNYVLKFKKRSSLNTPFQHSMNSFTKHNQMNESNQSGIQPDKINILNESINPMTVSQASNTHRNNLGSMTNSFMVNKDSSFIVRDPSEIIKDGKKINNSSTERSNSPSRRKQSGLVLEIPENEKEIKLKEKEDLKNEMDLRDKAREEMLSSYRVTVSNFVQQNNQKLYMKMEEKINFMKDILHMKRKKRYHSMNMSNILPSPQSLSMSQYNNNEQNCNNTYQNINSCKESIFNTKTSINSNNAINLIGQGNIQPTETNNSAQKQIFQHKTSSQPEQFSDYLKKSPSVISKKAMLRSALFDNSIAGSSTQLANTSAQPRQSFHFMQSPNHQDFFQDKTHLSTLFEKIDKAFQLPTKLKKVLLNKSLEKHPRQFGGQDYLDQSKELPNTTSNQRLEQLILARQQATPFLSGGHSKIGSQFQQTMEFFPSLRLDSLTKNSMFSKSSFAINDGKSPSKNNMNQSSINIQGLISDKGNNQWKSKNTYKSSILTRSIDSNKQVHPVSNSLFKVDQQQTDSLNSLQYNRKEYLQESMLNNNNNGTRSVDYNQKTLDRSMNQSSNSIIDHRRMLSLQLSQIEQKEEEKKTIMQSTKAAKSYLENQLKKLRDCSPMSKKGAPGSNMLRKSLHKMNFEIQ